MSKHLNAAFNSVRVRVVVRVRVSCRCPLTSNDSFFRTDQNDSAAIKKRGHYIYRCSPAFPPHLNICHCQGKGKSSGAEGAASAPSAAVCRPPLKATKGERTANHVAISQLVVENFLRIAFEKVCSPSFFSSLQKKKKEKKSPLCFLSVLYSCTAFLLWNISRLSIFFSLLVWTVGTQKENVPPVCPLPLKGGLILSSVRPSLTHSIDESISQRR